MPDSDGASVADLRAQSERLAVVYEAGDTESKNALQLMAAPLSSLIDVRERDVVGIELLDAMGAYDDSIGAIANRCAAVGSSALQ